MSTYSEKLKDPRWQRKRLCILQRDNFTCRDCGASDKQLHVHHCFYEKGDPWEIADRFLLTLCAECHTSRGDLEADAKRALACILASKPLIDDGEALRHFVQSLVQAATDETSASLAIVCDEMEIGILREAGR